MSKIIDSYKIRKIAVTIRETDNDNRLLVECNDGTFKSDFTVSRYEYSYYKRHMNQKILDAYKKGYEEEGGEEEL
jgi:hypothetical protein